MRALEISSGAGARWRGVQVALGPSDAGARWRAEPGGAGTGARWRWCTGGDGARWHWHGSQVALCTGGAETRWRWHGSQVALEPGGAQRARWRSVTDGTLLGELHVALSHVWHSAWRVARAQRRWLT